MYNIAQGFTAEDPVIQFIEGEGFQIYPVVDNYFLTMNPIAAWQSGVNNHVNVIMGENADEMSFFLPDPIYVTDLQKRDDYGMLYSIQQHDESATLKQWMTTWLASPIAVVNDMFEAINNDYQRYIVSV